MPRSGCSVTAAATAAAGTAAAGGERDRAPRQPWPWAAASRRAQWGALGPLQLGVALVLCAYACLVVDATVPHLCGPQCGSLLATYAHNDSCFRPQTQSFFEFDVQPHFHVGDRCFGENDPCAPFFFNGVYHMMWQSHTQYQHVPRWNKAPGGQFGDTGISFGHAVSTDLAHWTQLPNALWPDEWFTSGASDCEQLRRVLPWENTFKIGRHCVERAELECSACLFKLCWVSTRRPS